MEQNEWLRRGLIREFSNASQTLGDGASSLRKCLVAPVLGASSLDPPELPRQLNLFRTFLQQCRPRAKDRAAFRAPRLSIIVGPQ